MSTAANSFIESSDKQFTQSAHFQRGSKVAVKSPSCWTCAAAILKGANPPFTGLFGTATLGNVTNPAAPGGDPYPFTGGPWTPGHYLVAYCGGDIYGKVD